MVARIYTIIEKASGTIGQGPPYHRGPFFPAFWIRTSKAGLGFSSRSNNNGWFVLPRIGKKFSQVCPSWRPQNVTRVIDFRCFR
jgi:hypothetical protein